MKHWSKKLKVSELQNINFGLDLVKWKPWKLDIPQDQRLITLIRYDNRHRTSFGYCSLENYYENPQKMWFTYSKT